VSRVRKPRQTRLRMPVAASELANETASTSAFLRPKQRTAVHRRRRGALTSAVLALQVAGVLLAAGTASWSAYLHILASERLQVARVDVRGSRFLSDAEVRELLGQAVGQNILSLDIVSLLERLRSSPWVADATVQRALPDRLLVQIHERVPLALAEVEQLYLMDAEGVLIDIYGPHTAGFDLPIVRGLQATDPETRRDRARRAAILLGDLGDLAVEVSEVEVETSGDLRIVLRRYGEVLRMGAPPFREKFLTYLGLREDLLERCPRAEYFDLRFRDRIYAKEPLTLAVANVAPAQTGGR